MGGVLGRHAGSQADAERREGYGFEHGIRLRTDLHGGIDAVMTAGRVAYAPLVTGLAF
jgi:hypothetical protein